MKLLIGLPLFVILAVIGLFVLCRGLYLDQSNNPVGGAES